MDLVAISTSSPEGSVAVSAGGTIVSRTFRPQSSGHCALLFPALRDAFRSAGASLDSLRCAAVDRGPGSFTGIRIAVSSAEAFSLALRIRRTAMSSLDIIASQAAEDLKAKGGDQGRFLVAVDAGRKEFFAAEYLLSPNGEVDKTMEDSLFSEHEVGRWSQALAVYGYLHARNTNCPFGAKIITMYPSAEALARAVLAKGTVEDAPVLPYYIRAPHVILKPKKQAKL
jgi:tRNA threonylcarbamoyl adenosine modification protein YeaZ